MERMSLNCTNKTDNQSINLQWNRSICPNKTHRISCCNLLPIFKRDKINKKKKKTKPKRCNNIWLAFLFWVDERAGPMIDRTWLDPLTKSQSYTNNSIGKISVTYTFVGLKAGGKMGAGFTGDGHGRFVDWHGRLDWQVRFDWHGRLADWQRLPVWQSGGGLTDGQRLPVWQGLGFTEWQGLPVLHGGLTGDWTGGLWDANSMSISISPSGKSSLTSGNPSTEKSGSISSIGRLEFDSLSVSKSSPSPLPGSSANMNSSSSETGSFLTDFVDGIVFFFNWLLFPPLFEAPSATRTKKTPRSNTMANTLNNLPAMAVKSWTSCVGFTSTIDQSQLIRRCTTVKV